MHETEVVETKKLSDGQFSVRVRCCGDPSTDSCITLMPSQNEQVIEAAMLQHHKDIAARHAGINAAMSHPQVKVGTKCTHV